MKGCCGKIRESWLWMMKNSVFLHLKQCFPCSVLTFTTMLTSASMVKRPSPSIKSVPPWVSLTKSSSWTSVCRLWMVFKHLKLLERFRWTHKDIQRSWESQVMLKKNLNKKGLTQEWTLFILNHCMLIF